MNNFEDELNTFVILNKTVLELKDLIDTEYFYYIYFVILNKIKLIYMNMKGIDIVNTNNSYNLLRRRVDNDVKLVDEVNFRVLYSQCLDKNEQIVMYENLKNLYLYCFSKVETEILDNHTEKRIKLLSRI